MKIQEYPTKNMPTSGTGNITKATQLWKIFLSITVLVLVIWMSDIQDWASSLENLLSLLLQGLACAINLVCVSFRLKRILKHFGFSVSQSIALKASVSGYFASFFITSLLGQIT